MKPKLIDAHTHVNFAAFRDDADFVIKRALDAGVWMINVGTQKDTSQKAIELAEKYPEGVYATVGVHPIHTDKSFHDEQELGGDPEQQQAVYGASTGFTSRGEEFDHEYYKKLASHSTVVAIGECGLDYFRIKNPRTRTSSVRGRQEVGIKKQKDAFIKQIELAHEIKKPLMVHCRDAYDDLIDILKTYHLRLTPGIVHFFSGTKDHAQKLLDLGFYFTFGGAITFTRDYDEVVKYIPSDRILLETDAPYVAPATHRGKRNEPLYVKEVAKKLAEIKKLDTGEVGAYSVQSTRKLFGL